MRKLILLIFLSLLIYSCNEETKKENKSKDDIVLEHFESIIMEQMNDPDSYEFVSIKLIDSISYQDNINSRLDQYIRMQNTFKNSPDDLARYKMYERKIDSISKGLGEKKNSIASYTYIISARGNNSFGAKIKNDYIIQTSNKEDNYKILNLTTKKDKMFMTPNGFPGYEEVIKK